MNIENLDIDAFVELIRKRMADQEIPQKELAAVLGLSQAMVSIFLSGKRRLGSDHLVNLIKFFGIFEDQIPRLTEKQPRSKGNHIFISYSHRDKEYLDRLMVHLKPLERKGLIDTWVDTRLLAGDKWKTEIEKALNNARIAILLISADFLASDFIVDNELPPLLQAAEDKGTLILPVILKPCRFTREKTISQFQAINPPDDPLSLSEENERELIYDTIAQRIETVFDD